jgi:hypothetical protein
MKPFALIVALGLASALAPPLVAAEMPTTQADCEKAGMRWKEKASKCRPLREEGIRNVFGMIGLGCTLLGLIVFYREWRKPGDGPQYPKLAFGPPSQLRRPD